mmetsp:Transcript_16632/g.52352  ORF Transcript_16632/g.52352 Transcript_16632/m.52352 type:complete len:363 (+) Transcript_16632:606-1694(+)
MSIVRSAGEQPSGQSADLFTHSLTLFFASPRALRTGRASPSSVMKTSLTDFIWKTLPFSSGAAVVWAVWAVWEVLAILGGCATLVRKEAWISGYLPKSSTLTLYELVNLPTPSMVQLSVRFLPLLTCSLTTARSPSSYLGQSFSWPTSTFPLLFRSQLPATFSMSRWPPLGPGTRMLNVSGFEPGPVTTACAQSPARGPLRMRTSTLSPTAPSMPLTSMRLTGAGVVDSNATPSCPSTLRMASAGMFRTSWKPAGAAGTWRWYVSSRSPRETTWQRCQVLACGPLTSFTSAIMPTRKLPAGKSSPKSPCSAYIAAFWGTAGGSSAGAGVAGRAISCGTCGAGAVYPEPRSLRMRREATLSRS